MKVRFKNWVKQVLLFSVCSILFNTCQKDIKVSSVNSFGTILGNGNQQSIGEIIQTKEGDYLICGTVTRGENGMEDGYLMKLDQNFNLLWSKNYGGSKNDFISAMAMDEDGNILMAGDSYSYGTSIDSTYHQMNSLLYFLYTDKNGNIIWQKTYQPKGNLDTINYGSFVRRVINLHDKSFCIAGSSFNFPSIGGNLAGSNTSYSMAIESNGNIKWSKVFYVASDYWETIDDVTQCADGNVMLLIESFNNNFISNIRVNLIKASNTPAPFKFNGWILKGPYINDIAPFEKNGYIEMEPISDDIVAITDQLKGELIFTKNTGAIDHRKAFKFPVYNMKIRRQDNQLIITGQYNSGQGINPCWIITDLNGNISKENYLQLDPGLSENLAFNSAFINKKNEVIIIGFLHRLEYDNIVMLRYDEMGNLIK